MDRETRRVLKVYFRLGWKKLHDYYEKLNPVAYYAAVILHPAKKMIFLDDLWKKVPCKQRDGWREWLWDRLKLLWQEEYMKRYAYELSIYLSILIP